MSSAFAELAVLLVCAAGAPGSGGSGASGAAPAPADDAARIAQLLATFHGMTTLRAHFHDEKHMAILAVPLASDGELYFQSPDRLTREVTAPSPNKMVIAGDHLSFSEGHGVQSIPLDQNPIARSFVDSFIKILSGDREGLERLYAISLARPSGDRWGLSLKPKGPPLSALLESIELSGHGQVVDRMRIREAGGDDTVTTFTAVELGRAFSADEQRRLFGFDAAPPAAAKP